MDKQLLRDSVDVLKRIRTELQSNVESSVIVQLDRVIQNLETAQESGVDTVVTALEILLLLGQLIEKIPEIAEAIDFVVR